VDETSVVTTSVKEFLFYNNVSDNKTDLAVQCFIDQAYPGCTIGFSLPCADTVAVEVSILSYTEKNDFPNIRNRIVKFLSEMVQSPKCQAQKIANTKAL